MTICVPFYSQDGHCRAMAGAIAEGAGGAALDVTQLGAADWAMMGAAEAIVFASPTYMGSVAARYGAFLEEAAADWPDHGWRNKIAAGASVACHPSGDKLQTLTRMAVFAAQMGMIWVGAEALGAPVREGALNRDGSWLGLMATDAPGGGLSAADLETARLFGARVAWAAARWGA